jgi:hypothetical protein
MNLIALIIAGILFVPLLRLGVFAWEKLGKHSNAVLGAGVVAAMLLLYPFLQMASLFDLSVLPSFIVVHACGGTIVCSIIAKWVENKARKDLEREAQLSRVEK